MEDLYQVNIHYSVDDSVNPVVVDYHEDCYKGRLVEQVYSDGVDACDYKKFVGTKEECHKWLKMRLWKKGLSLAMQGQLWYTCCDQKTGVTSDPSMSERTSWDVLVATKKSSREMRKRGYEKATKLLHTFLRLLETSNELFIKECFGEISIQYNRKVYWE